MVRKRYRQTRVSTRRCITALPERASICGYRGVATVSRKISLAADATSRRMRVVRQENTLPELLVRKALHAYGLRFLTHPRALPGKPDIVLPKHRAVVFVHGCFWHGHSCSHGRKQSKTNVGYWTEKIAENRRRDRRKAAALRRLGWKVKTVWQCQVKSGQRIAALVKSILE
jgi:DNA mismatch endonuclease (patch repair protein)